MIEIKAASDRSRALTLGTSGANAMVGNRFSSFARELYGNEEFANGRRIKRNQ
jgi:hypothetical protein